jgi:hypothetical protein
VGFLLLAGVEPPLDWGLIECTQDIPGSDVLIPVAAETSQAIDAGKRYPPALALAREAVDAEARAGTLGHEALAARYAQAVEEQLRREADGDWVLARAVCTEPGYLRKGDLYWVRPSSVAGGTISWVAWNYFVYRNPVSGFDLWDAFDDS